MHDIQGISGKNYTSAVIPVIYQEFMDGNITISKNQISFCAVGEDHALEHINWIMKVPGGFVGITQNASTMERLVLAAPELSIDLLKKHIRWPAHPTDTRQEHHDLPMAVWM